MLYEIEVYDKKGDRIYTMRTTEYCDAYAHFNYSFSHNPNVGRTVCRLNGEVLAERTA